MSDGTGPGTRALTNFSSSVAGGFCLVADRLLFALDGGSGDIELWAVRLVTLGSFHAQRIGLGCAGTAGRTPSCWFQGEATLGTTSFAVTLAEARPLAPCALLLGGGATRASARAS